MSGFLLLITGLGKKFGAMIWLMEKSRRSTGIKLAATITNAFLLIYFTFQLLNQPFVHGNEVPLIQGVTYFKNIVLNLEDKPHHKDLMFIDVAYDKQMIEKLDTNGFPIGKQAITDRKKLAKFFKVLNRKPSNQKFVICDIFFADPATVDECAGDTASADVALRAELAKMKNIVLSYHFKEDKDSLDLPIFRAPPRGIADYATTNNTFLKFNLLYRDSIKSSPLVMYETLHKQSLKKGKWFYWLSGKRILKSFIVDFKVRNYDLFVSKNRYKVDNLDALLTLDDEDILAHVKDRIIVVGDFQSDKHETIYGETVGPLILLNTYLGLLNGDNVVTPMFLIFLFGCFFCLSMMIFYPANYLERWLKNTFENTQFKSAITLLSYMSLLIVTSALSFFLFNIHLSILLLTIYLYVLKNIVRFIYRRLGWIEKNGSENEQKATLA
ncbi:hypothetical protein M23134_02226 [Microscilla marina ATCC 23134]|uniref:CHASE2 domain-containing protein n=2 Tax=Microscilla marina TaxID=1027 RepID=A1ZNK5_MICM2|nr:hypothetical protein M23134_02226 [Microscilla marina ATCC 23134]